MNLFDQILNQAKLTTPGQLSGGTSFGSISTQDFQSKLPTIQKQIGVENEMKSKYGLEDKDIRFLKKAKEQGYKFEDAMSFIQKKKQEEQKAQNPELGIMGGLKEGAIGATQFGQQAPAAVGNLLDLTQRYITTPILAGGAEMLGNEDLATRIRAGGEKFGRLAKESGQETTERAMQAFGPLTENQLQARQTGANLALTAPIPLGKVPKILQGSKLLPTIGRGAYYGAVGTPTYTAVSEGRLPTGGEMVAGTVGGAVAGPLLEKAVIPAVGGIASKTQKYGTALVKGGTEGLKKSVARDISSIKTPGVETITRNIPKAVVRRDLGFTPTERAKIEKITGQDEGTYILSKGLAGKGKEELAEIFMKQSDDMYNGITRELSKVEGRVQSPVAKEALLDILEQLESSPKIARAYAKDIEGVKSMLAREDFSLSELNNIRRAYDKVNTGMFTVQGKARSGLENAIDVKVRQDLSSQLQKEAKKYGVDVKAMNTELRAGLEMKDALLRRLSQEERNNFIGLQDLGVSAILSGGEPVSAVATIVAKKYAEKIAPGLAQKAFNLNKAPNVTRSVNRGNTITPRNKSSQLGLASNPGTPVVSNVVKPIKKPKVKPSPQVKPVEKTVKASEMPKYLYHGTNSDVLDNIIKEGLKPGRRGQLSLSKTEEYGKSFALDGITPNGKTNGVLFRIKSDSLKGKTTTKRIDGKMRPPQDEVNELLTSETILPENIEILRNGKWQPLVSSPKPLSPQKTVKLLTPKKESATMGDMETKKLIEEARKTPVYHGTNVEFKNFDQNRINTVESSGDYIGEGFYFTTSKESAKKYAQQAVKKKGGKEIIKEVTLDMKKPFIINSKSDIQKLNDIFGGEDNRIELLMDNPKAVREKLQSLGYDGLIDNLYGQRAVFNAKQIISK